MDLTLILWPYVWYAVSAGDRPHHVMTDETFPSFGCREASDLIAVWTFPTLHPFPCRQTWFVSTSPFATDEIPPVSVPAQGLLSYDIMTS
jgi:hypothetical protein